MPGYKLISLTLFHPQIAIKLCSIQVYSTQKGQEPILCKLRGELLSKYLCIYIKAVAPKTWTCLIPNTWASIISPRSIVPGRVVRGEKR